MVEFAMLLVCANAVEAQTAKVAKKAVRSAILEG